MGLILSRCLVYVANEVAIGYDWLHNGSLIKIFSNRLLTRYESLSAF